MTTSARAMTSVTDAQWNGQREAVADFVRRFEETWAKPDPDRINGLVHSDIEFFQPLEGAVHGHEEARAFWRRLFTLIPDIHGEVLS